MKRRNTAPDAGATVTESPVFATYLEAHDEATRRRAQEAARGFIVEVAKSPYGGTTFVPGPKKSWRTLICKPYSNAASRTTRTS